MGPQENPAEQAVVATLPENKNMLQLGYPFIRAK
jgi:hypothetical protein